MISERLEILTSEKAYHTINYFKWRRIVNKFVELECVYSLLVFSISVDFLSFILPLPPASRRVINELQKHAFERLFIIRKCVRTGTSISKWKFQKWIGDKSSICVFLGPIKNNNRAKQIYKIRIVQKTWKFSS